VRPSLFGAIDEVEALDELRHHGVNYDQDRSPEGPRPDGHWHVDAGSTVIAAEQPGPPVPGGPWELARDLVGQYEFADGPILRAVYRSEQSLLGRDMLLEGRFFGLRLYLGVRVTAVTDEVQSSDNGPERVWGWSYQTLQGHVEQGRLTYEVVKGLDTGNVIFRIRGYSRPAPIPDPVIRFGFFLFGRWTQQRFYRNVQARMRHLLRAAQRGMPMPEPTVRADGIVLAPSGVRPRPWERLTRGRLHAGR
jgi:uncharacterized protein (UPF0548 family)